jgi:peptidoglycan/LPS O-acetylase OafA/YrhL
MKEIKKYDYIDSLRGIAVLFVHTGSFFNMNMFPKFFKTIQENGATGVQLFFILSSLTLFMSFQSRMKNERNCIRNFFIRRFFRIAPMYYLVIILGLFYFGLGQRYWLGDCKDVSILNISSHFIFTNGLNPYYINSILGIEWSIGVEMLFYLLIPVLFKNIKNSNEALKLLFIYLLFYLPLSFILGKLSIIESQRLWSNFLFLFFPNQFPVFILGIILYFIIAKNDIKFDKLFIFLIVILFCVGFIKDKLWIYSISILFCLFILLIWKYNFKLIVNIVFIFIGKISYSIYLTHIFCIGLINTYFRNDKIEFQNMNWFALYYIFLLVSTIILSFITYQIIEKNGIKLGSYIIEKLEKNTTINKKH